MNVGEPVVSEPLGRAYISTISSLVTEPREACIDVTVAELYRGVKGAIENQIGNQV
jgi:hypothetical protein